MKKLDIRPQIHHYKAKTGKQIHLFITPTGTDDKRSWSQANKSLAATGERRSRDSTLLRNTDLAKAGWQLEAGTRPPLLIAAQSGRINEIKKPLGPVPQRLFHG